MDDWFEQLTLPTNPLTIKKLQVGVNGVVQVRIADFNGKTHDGRKHVLIALGEGMTIPTVTSVDVSLTIQSNEGQLTPTMNRILPSYVPTKVLQLGDSLLAMTTDVHLIVPTSVGGLLMREAW